MERQWEVPSPVFTKRKRQALYANPSEAYVAQPHTASAFSGSTLRTQTPPAQALRRPGFLPNTRAAMSRAPNHSRMMTSPHPRDHAPNQYNTPCRTSYMHQAQPALPSLPARMPTSAPYTPRGPQHPTPRPASQAIGFANTPLNSPSQSSSPDLDCSLHILTSNIAGLVKWGQHKELPLMFQIFGQLNSAVTDRLGGKMFVLKSDTDIVNCVFYQIDRPLPRMARNNWYRCVGSYNSKQGLLKCVSVRAMLPNEEAVIQPSVNASEKAMRQWLAQHKSLESRKARK